jgi:hypothetical protein
MRFREILQALLAQSQGLAGTCRSAAANAETHDDMRAWPDVCQALDVLNDYLDATVAFVRHWGTTAPPGATVAD